MTKLIFKKIHENAIIPAFAHEGDAGMDIWATYHTELAANVPQIVSTGLTVDIPCGFELQVRSRSGLSFNKNIYLANGVGTIDSGYEGEIKILLVSPYAACRIDRSKAIAQLVLCKLEPVTIYEAGEDLPKMRTNYRFEDRGAQGFGSSDN
jgi:dUTP pyrophosphatase